MSSAEPGAHRHSFLLDALARRTPDAPAIVAVMDDGGAQTTVSYAELERRVAVAAAALTARGLRRGDRVAILLPPAADHLAVLLGVIRAGMVAVPVSTRLPPAAVAALVAEVGCAALVAAPGAGDATPPALGRIEPAALLGHGRRACGPLPPFDATGDATVVFTSGSSGRPKAALHAYAAHVASAAGSNENLPFGERDRWLLSLPLWHVGGLAILFRAFLGGGAVAIARPGEALAASILALGATHVSVVATQLARLLRDPEGEAALAQLRAVLLGGGPAPEALVREAVRRGVRLMSSYGSTELASTATATRPGDAAELLLTAGRPLAGREIAVSPDGEILARGATLFRGYLTPAGLHPARDAAGWFATGDLGWVGADGCLRVTGRRDAMFVSGGENIHPEEIEAELLRHPAVEEAMVVPVADPEFGERPAAFVRTAGPGPDAAELDAFLRRTLPGFKVPVRYLPWPAAAEGVKPLRRELCELARPGPGGRG